MVLHWIGASTIGCGVQTTPGGRIYLSRLPFPLPLLCRLQAQSREISPRGAFRPLLPFWLGEDPTGVYLSFESSQECRAGRAGIRAALGVERVSPDPGPQCALGRSHVLRPGPWGFGALFIQGIGDNVSNRPLPGLHLGQPGRVYARFLRQIVLGQAGPDT